MSSRSDHEAAAAEILWHLVGVLNHQDREGGVDDARKARSWDTYAEEIRQWEASAPKDSEDS